MADEQQDMISEWNQQYVFDQITNELCWRGYNAQIKQDVLTWHYILEALYLHVSPILNESEKNELKNLLTVIRREMNYHMTAPKSIQTGLLGEIYVLLFHFEEQLRNFTNRHNSFINKRQNADFTEF